MITVNIYQIIGSCNLDWKRVESKKRFKSVETAHKYCVYIAPKIHGCGNYAYILIN